MKVLSLPSAYSNESLWFRCLFCRFVLYHRPYLSAVFWVPGWKGRSDHTGNDADSGLESGADLPGDFYRGGGVESDGFRWGPAPRWPAFPL